MGLLSEDLPEWSSTKAQDPADERTSFAVIWSCSFWHIRRRICWSCLFRKRERFKGWDERYAQRWPVFHGRTVAWKTKRKGDGRAALKWCKCWKDADGRAILAIDSSPITIKLEEYGWSWDKTCINTGSGIRHDEVMSRWEKSLIAVWNKERSGRMKRSDMQETDVI